MATHTRIESNWTFSRSQCFRNELTVQSNSPQFTPSTTLLEPARHAHCPSLQYTQPRPKAVTVNDRLTRRLDAEVAKEKRHL